MGFAGQSRTVDGAAPGRELGAARFPDRSPGYARRYLAFAEDLEALFGQPVDPLTSQRIQNPYFRASVNWSRTTIYESPDSEAAG
jgi:hypothetical protein